MNRMRRFRFIVFLCALMLTSCAATMRNLRSAQLLENLGNEYYLLASLYEESGKYDKALELYKKARNAGCSKTERELAFKIARNAALAKDWDAALKEYENLLTDYKEYIAEMEKKDVLSENEKKNLKEAKENFETLIKLK